MIYSVDKPESDNSEVVTLIGDIVDSKRQPDRRGTQALLIAAMQATDRVVSSVQPLDVTVGDEFQAVYANVADAARAALLLRLTMLPAADTRYGLGRGEMTVFDASRRPVSQDGPAWWAARAAIDEADVLGRRPRSRHARTWLAGAGADVGAVNAFLSCRDAIVHRMNARTVRLLQGALLGRSQDTMAELEGVRQPAVSQALSGSGAYAVLESDALLRRLA